MSVHGRLVAGAGKGTAGAGSRSVVGDDTTLGVDPAPKLMVEFMP
jgi:hypothetical protein